jgi:hypothetical protein
VDAADAALIAAAGILVIAAFQLALALGAPLGRAAWGGRHDRLPTNLRRSSAVAAVVWVIAALVILGRGGYLDVPGPVEFTTWGAWIVAVVLGLGAVVNVASSSPWERFGWAPFAALLAVLSVIAASRTG